MHEVLVNHLGGLSLPRKSVVRLTDRPTMTLDVYRGRKTTIKRFLPLFLKGSILKGKNLLLNELIHSFKSRPHFRKLPSSREAKMNSKRFLLCKNGKIITWKYTFKPSYISLRQSKEMLMLQFKVRGWYVEKNAC